MVGFEDGVTSRFGVTPVYGRTGGVRDPSIRTSTGEPGGRLTDVHFRVLYLVLGKNDDERGRVGRPEGGSTGQEKETMV